MQIDRDFERTVHLSNGQLVHIRLLRPGDERLLLEGFSNLSTEGRYQRFHGAVAELSPTWLHYLADVDQRDHIAVGAYSDTAPQHGLGVARCVRFPEDPTAAEVAVTVVDRAQHQGLGSMLFGVLSVAAYERGIQRFRACVLGSNANALSLIHGLTPLTSEHCSQGEVEIGMDVARIAESVASLEGDHPGRALLKLAAQGLVFRPPRSRMSASPAPPAPH
ncbi:MAG: GNAT family N-acetyltransferase [Deltaproteobacteria bacterium]|nr:GNAT family N-acetyltransferase [Deltaproteobacteria bacterium]